MHLSSCPMSRPIANQQFMQKRDEEAGIKRCGEGTWRRTGTLNTAIQNASLHLRVNYWWSAMGWILSRKQCMHYLLKGGNLSGQTYNQANGEPGITISWTGRQCGLEPSCSGDSHCVAFLHCGFETDVAGSRFMKEHPTMGRHMALFSLEQNRKHIFHRLVQLKHFLQRFSLLWKFLTFYGTFWKVWF